MPREQYQIRWKDYYQILEVEATAGTETINAAFRRLARAYHPDRNYDPNATEKFQEINEAKEILSDRIRRANYDQEYWARQRGETFEEPYEGSSGSYGYEDHQEHRGNEESQAFESHWGSYSGSNGAGSGSHQWNGGTGYRWGGHRRSNGSWNRQRSRDFGTEETRTSGDTRSDEATVEENLEDVYSSRFFLWAFISYLVDRISPNPDETQRVLPWPSWVWQRSLLLAGVPLAVLVLLFSVAQAAWLLVVVSALWSAAALYSGILTRWLRNSRQAPPWARVTGGTCIVLSGLGYALALAYATLIITMLVVSFLIMGVILRAMLEQTLDRR